jgi:hypothetical protein
MVMVSTASKDTGNQRGKAIAIALRNQEVQQTSRLRNAMVLLAIIAFGTAMAAHAHAAERVGNASGGFHGTHTLGSHMQGGFGGPILDGAPSMPAPTFNSSEPYTVPQSPEMPVSPASPGSVFGNG